MEIIAILIVIAIIWAFFSSRNDSDQYRPLYPAYHDASIYLDGVNPTKLHLVLHVLSRGNQDLLERLRNCSGATTIQCSICTTWTTLAEPDSILVHPKLDALYSSKTCPSCGQILVSNMGGKTALEILRRSDNSSFSDLADWVHAEFSSSVGEPDRLSFYCQAKRAGIGYSVYKQWCRAEISILADIVAFQRVGIVPDDLGPDTVGRREAILPFWRTLVSNGIPIQDAWRYASLGVWNERTAVLRLWREGVTPARCSDFITNGITSTDAIIMLKGIVCIGDWVDLGISADAIKSWADYRFVPDEARLWLRADFDAPTAAAWRACGFGERDARRWQSSGCSPLDAQRWRSAGAEHPRKRRRWIRTGFDDQNGPSWQAAGFGTRAAQRWRDVGVTDGGQALAWRDLGFQPRQVLEWVSEGIEPEIAVAWKASGLGDEWRVVKDPSVASAWEAAGATPEMCSTWARHLDDPRRAQAFYRAGLPDPAIAAEWMEAGVSDPAEAVLLTKAGVTADDYRSWRALECDGPASARSWAARWSVRDAGRWCQAAGCNLKTAWVWHRLLGGDLAAMREWNRAGFEAPSIASTWLSAGFEPIRAQAWLDVGANDPADVAQAERDGCTFDQVERWIEQGAEDLESARIWQQRWSPAEAASWCALTGEGLDVSWWLRAITGSQEELRGWRELGFIDVTDIQHALELPPDLDVRERRAALTAMRDAGVALPHDALALVAAGWSPSAVVAWAEAGVLTLGEVQEWSDHGFDAATCAEWWHLSDRPHVAAKWRDVADDDVQVARLWQHAGIGEPAEASRLLAAGLTAEAASRWCALGVEGVEEFTYWHRRWTCEVAQTWCSGLAASVRSAHDWHTATSGDLSAARAWLATGLAQPDRAYAWSAAGYGPDTASPWIASGIDDPNVARPWHQEQFSPPEARAWLKAGRMLRTAKEWRAAGFATTQAITWLAASVRAPRVARDLERIGFDAESYSAATRGLDSAQCDSVIRRQAFRHIGLGLIEERPSLEVADGETHIGNLIGGYASALAAAGEHELVVVHGAPHLSLRAIRALPNARYVRGAAKARLWHALDAAEFPNVHSIVDGDEYQPHLIGDEQDTTRLVLDGVSPKWQILLLGECKDLVDGGVRQRGDGVSP